jgi:hypothetical protein
VNLEQLRTFCTTDDTRVNLLFPYTIGEFSYASDGRMMVRIPKIETDEPIPGPQSSPRLFPTHRTAAAELPPGWQELHGEENECEGCKGSGQRYPHTMCPDCKGEGTITCEECDHERECRNCHSTGTITDTTEALLTCLDCDGVGRWEDTVAISVSRGVTYVSNQILKKVVALPGWKLFLPREGKGEALHFTFEGGEGLIMPMDPFHSWVIQEQRKLREAEFKAQWNPPSDH